MLMRYKRRMVQILDLNRNEKGSRSEVDEKPGEDIFTSRAEDLVEYIDRENKMKGPNLAGRSGGRQGQIEAMRVW